MGTPTRRAARVGDSLRLAYAFDGIYLQAFVSDYGDVRTFSVERIRTLAMLDEQFEPRPMAFSYLDASTLPRARRRV